MSRIGAHTFERKGPDSLVSDRRPTSGTDSRPARREALEAAALWAVALIVTVGLSTLLGAAHSDPIFGVPRWAAIGVFGPWLAFFALHLWFCRRRKVPQSDS